MSAFCVEMMVSFALLVAPTVTFDLDVHDEADFSNVPAEHVYVMLPFP